MIPDGLELRPVLAGHQYDDPDICCIDRIIGEYELIYFLGGTGHVAINGIEYKCASGDIVLICPFEEHSIWSSRSHPHDNFWVHFDISPSYIQKKFVEYMFPQKNRKRFVGINDGLINMYSKMLFEIREKRPGYIPMLKFLFTAIVIEMIRFLENSRINDTRPSMNCISRDTRILAVAEAFILENYSSKINIDDICKEAAISKSYLFRIFNQYLKVSPIRYLSRVRLKKAAHMILSTSYSLKEIAQKTGFSDQFYFSRAFKKNYGINPSEYGKNIRY